MCDVHVHVCVPLFVWVGITFLPLYSLASVLCTCVHIYMYYCQQLVFQRELSEVAAVAEQQRSVLVQHEEETNRLRQEVREMEARERETEEQGHREHQEDTASLAILHKQLSTLTNEK